MEVRLEFLMPREIDRAKRACPTLFLPLGTIEWHGLHNVVGLDALKAHALCVRAAQQDGGLVHPPLYGGVGGLDEPHTFVFDPEHSLESRYLRSWVEKLCWEGHRNGFKAIIVLTGHYGAGQQMAVREAAVRMSKVLNIPVLGTPEYFLALDQEYYGDHAAFFETSLMMYLYPELVDVNRLGEPPYQGVGGRDPKKYATAEDGERFSRAIIGRLGTMARCMPAWDRETLMRFVRAEEALVTRQMTLAGGGGATAWTAWRHIGKGAFNAYPQLLAEGRFEEIEVLVENL